MTVDTKSILENSVKEFAQYLEGKIPPKKYFDLEDDNEVSIDSPANALISNALDYTVKVRRGGRLANFEITVTLGGPNIWCDREFVYGVWAGTKFQMSYEDKIGLFGAMEKINHKR